MASSINISRVIASFALFSLLLSTVADSSVANSPVVNAPVAANAAVSANAAVADSSSANCSRTCKAELCDTMGIKYGKYCGVGYWGCPGEKPCDDIDACCMGHDECVDRFGMTHVKCHKRLKNCLIREQKANKVGFSKECPANVAVPTMIKGMDLAILLSELGGNMPDIEKFI